MTETEWLSCTDASALCDFARNATTTIRTRWHGWKSGPRFRISDRKWRLICIHCALRACPIQPELTEELIQQVEEGALPEKWPVEVPLILTFLPRFINFNAIFLSFLPMLAEYRAGVVVGGFPLEERSELRQQQLALERAWQADIVRDVLGNLFRPESVDPFWLDCNDRAAGLLLRQIRANNDYSALPILADALEEAGCSSSGLLEHLRHPGPHVRGCWAIDLLANQT